jgi:MFS transporter, DHA1 family, multidrug resistance protein
MSRRRLTLILGTLSTIGPLSIDLVLPSFTIMASSLGVSVAAVQLTLAAYLAGVATGQLVHGPLSDRFGRRPPLLGGLALYVAAAASGAAAWSLPSLLAARFGQGLGACAVIVVSRAVVHDRCSDRDAATLYSWRVLVMGAAPVLAPFAGGHLAATAGWRTLFVVLAAVGLALLGLMALALPESRPPRVRTRGGLGDALRSTGAALRDRRFLRLSLAGGASEAAMFAGMAGAPFVFVELSGMSPERLGLVSGANALGVIAASQANRWLLARVGVREALRVGVVAGVLSYAVLVFAARADAGPFVLATAMVAGVSSSGIVLPNATAAAMGARGDRAGSASAVLGLLQSTVGALAAGAVTLYADGTARPMATVMLGCGATALALVWRERGAKAREGELDREGPARAWFSRPRVRVVAERSSLRADDAEALAGGRLEHPPRLDLLHPLRSERLEPADLGLDVVRLDVQVDAARVTDPLEDHDGLIRAVLERHVVPLALSLGATERPRPEAGGRVEIGLLAVDDQRAEPAPVHGGPPVLWRK